MSLEPLKPELQKVLDRLLSLHHEDLYQFNTHYQAKLKERLIMQNNS